jgi:hypothetical protein
MTCLPPAPATHQLMAGYLPDHLGGHMGACAGCLQVSVLVVQEEGSTSKEPEKQAEAIRW